MEEAKENKRMEEKPNKTLPMTSPQPSPRVAGEGGKMKIRLKPGRAAEGVTADEHGAASVDAKTAEYLVRIGYAEYVN